MNKDFKIPPPSLPRPVGPAAPRLPQAGDEIDGRYRLVKKIGVGKHRAIRAIMTGRGKTEHLPGQLLNNRYKIIAELGSGIMSTVFVAEDVEEKKTVAVKVLSADLPPEFRASERFGREIEMLDALEHPNIIRLLGHGFDLSLDRHFLVIGLRPQKWRGASRYQTLERDACALR